MPPARLVIIEAPPPKPSTWSTLIPALPGVAATIVAIWAVHRLTKSREREKAVFDLYKATGEVVAPIKDSAAKVWSHRRGPDRKQALAETKWRLQQLGASVERLRRLSRRKKWQWAWPPRADVSIHMRVEMKDLRDAITADPFEDPDRNIDKSRIEGVEQAIGFFLTALDEKFYRWMR
jgi:hypothetical protein